MGKLSQMSISSPISDLLKSGYWGPGPGSDSSYIFLWDTNEQPGLSTTELEAEDPALSLLCEVEIGEEMRYSHKVKDLNPGMKLRR